MAGQHGSNQGKMMNKKDKRIATFLAQCDSPPTGDGATLHDWTMRLAETIEAAERERWCELVGQLVACHEEPSCPAVEWAKDMLAGREPPNEELCAGSETQYLASERRPRDGEPRFCVSDGGRTISDEDFIFDALISVGGDFGEEAMRTRYAQWVCDALNEADKQLPREPRGPNVRAKPTGAAQP